MQNLKKMEFCETHRCVSIPKERGKLLKTSAPRSCPTPQFLPQGQHYWTTILSDEPDDVSSDGNEIDSNIL